MYVPAISELLRRLAPQYDETPAADVHRRGHWPGKGWGAALDHIHTLVIHFTEGWPSRDKANDFVRRYTDATVGPDWFGIGPQAFISGDGTVFRLIDLSRALAGLTWHGEWINHWALGVETGNLGTKQPPSTDHRWIAANADPENLPGMKLWITGVNQEVQPAWWTTASYSGPARGAIRAGHMLFSEHQMQAHALLARYLCEEFGLPRNFLVLPHEGRESMIDDSVKYRQLVVADERADMLMRAVAAAPINIPAASFGADPASAAALQGQYHGAIVPAGHGQHQYNGAYNAFCATYRGIHSHRISGALNVRYSEHDCPNPLFDWHRMAREVSDYWWFPFDVVGGRTNVEVRQYRHWGADTKVVEYYFDESEADRLARVTVGIHGPGSSPDTFSLDPASPIYAMSNGELVAARFPEPGAGVSMAFVLVRHDVYHERPFSSVVPFADFFDLDVPPGPIDYDQAPETGVYTLYMHLGRAPEMSFEHVSDGNPDWLNRLLARQKECYLGVEFYDASRNHHGIGAGAWNSVLPALPRRPTTLRGWRQDKDGLATFTRELAAGRVALMPRLNLTVPPRILLGDFLGHSGVIRAEPGTPPRHGIRVETFAPSFAAPTFSTSAASSDWSPPGVLQPPHCLQYSSEWRRDLTQTELAALTAIGVDADQLFWWGDVVVAQLLDGVLPRDAQLPNSGVVWHYRPLEFAKWINGVTWASEWPKYEVTDAAGNAVPRPPRPRSRRV